MVLPNYPALAALPEVQAALETVGLAVFSAPPGSGKTTVLPLGLLPHLTGNVILLEPRRVAARAAAARMASLLAEKVGDTIGYQVRFDRKISQRTRIEVVTEGLLTRRLLQQPDLPKVELLIFDEFHERSLDADLALALALDIRANLNPDLKILVMSATLDSQRISDLLGGAPQIKAEGSLFPVEIKHFVPSYKDLREIGEAVAEGVKKAWAETSGDVLAFLPGVREIRWAQERLLGFNVFPLYGELPADQQDAALRPSDRRKVILATNLAQTSLTVEGVTTVVDGGWARVARFDLNLGVNVLETVRVSRASADQRAGRAGRLSAGTCYRLWHPETVLPAYEKAEIQQQDVTRLALDLAQWGSKVADMALLDQPPASHWRYAQTVLQGLEAIEHESKISSHGKALNRLPTHPRLAHLLLKAKAMGESHTGAWVAAALEQRSGSDKDLSQRLRSLQHDRATQDSARQFLRVLDASEGHLRPDLAGRMLAWAYPERIALHKGKGVYGCADGQEALLADHPTGFPTWLAIAHWRDDQKILLYADLDEADVLQDHPPRLESVVTWDAQNECVIAESQQRLGQLVLSKKPLQNPPAALVQAALLQALGKRGLQALPWTDSAQQWQARVQCLRAWQGTSWPDVSDEALSQDWAWLAPHLSGMSRFSHLERLDLMQVFNGLLDYSQQQALNRLAPTSIGVPSGLKHGLHYEAGKAPVLEVKLQELFGATQTPTVCDGKIKVLLHLLSPGRKPAAVTDDLVRFWANGYADVKKDLKGRYPRHPWPDNPLEAPPTHRAKPRGT